MNLFNGSYPMPDDHVPPEDILYFPDVEYEDWLDGRCYNCGCWAARVKDGEYECENCGDTWDIYEPPSEIP